MQLLIALLSLFVSTSDAEALQRTARDTRLTLDTAAQHIAAARIAGMLADVDPDILLAIAHHESRYEVAVIGPVVRGRRACGVLQQVPVARCPEPSLLRDYVAGAAHLRTWIAAERGDLARALRGYAGGYALLRLCDRGEAQRTCSVAARHTARAGRIKRERTRGRDS